jgi:hypothetical protein
MKGTRHSEEQIIAILKQGEAGLNCALNALRRYRARGDFATPLPGGGTMANGVWPSGAGRSGEGRTPANE